MDEGRKVNGQLHVLAALLQRERAPVTHWAGDWTKPRGHLDEVKKKKIFARGI
jgi:hypothetical protein